MIYVFCIAGNSSLAVVAYGLNRAECPIVHCRVQFVVLEKVTTVVMVTRQRRVDTNKTQLPTATMTTGRRGRLGTRISYSITINK